MHIQSHSLHGLMLQVILNRTLLPKQELAGDDWWLDRKGEIPEGAKPFFRLPIFHYHKARHSAAMHCCLLCCYTAIQAGPWEGYLCIADGLTLPCSAFRKPARPATWAQAALLHHGCMYSLVLCMPDVASPVPTVLQTRYLAGLTQPCCCRAS